MRLPRSGGTRTRSARGSARSRGPRGDRRDGHRVEDRAREGAGVAVTAPGKPGARINTAVPDAPRRTRRAAPRVIPAVRGRDPARGWRRGLRAETRGVAHRRGHAASADATSILAEALGHCAGLRTLTAEIGLSGRAAGQRIRVRLIAGLAAPDGIRLEADGADRPARVHPCVGRRRHHTAAAPRRSRAQGRAAGGDPRGARRHPRDAGRAAPPAGGMPGRRRRRDATCARSATIGCSHAPAIGAPPTSAA